MKNNITTVPAGIAMAVLVLFISSCTNTKWDEHYKAPSYMNKNLFEVLVEDPNYSVFVDLLVKTQCDTLLRNGNQNTVFALTNSALSDFNTGMGTDELTAIMRMHIASSAVYLNRGGNSNTPAVSGKMLKFRGTSNGHTVNNVSITQSEGTKASNGVIYNVKKTISSLPNLYDVISSHPDLTLYKKFIDENMFLIPDPIDNIVIGYDTLNNPVYEEPVKYIHYSEFLERVKPDDELTISTAFLPSNAFVLKAYDKLLAARDGRIDLIAPRLSYYNKDTIVAQRYFRMADGPFPGDSALLLNKIFTHAFVRGEIPSLAGAGTFTNIVDERLTVSPGQVKSGATEASNGYYYIMDDVTVPDIFFRSEFWITPQIKTTSTNYVNNPAVVFKGMTNSAGVTTQQYCHTGRYTAYNCVTTGSGIGFKWPFVTAGKYTLIFSYFSGDQSGVFDVAHGVKILKKDLVTGSYYNLRMLLNVVTELGTVNVDTDGEVEIVFTCSNVRNSPRNEDSFRLLVDYIMLQPTE